MAGLCKVTIIGRLSRDPEMRYTPSGKAVTSFNVPVNRVFTGGDGERKEETEWFRVNAWGRLAETCNNYLRKGMQVYVEGRLSTRTWQGQDGEKRFSLEIFASEMQMLGDRGDQPREVAVGAGVADTGGDDLDADDLPF
jgi:single-strand DNA-binding protein